MNNRAIFCLNADYGVIDADFDDMEVETTLSAEPIITSNDFAYARQVRNEKVHEAQAETERVANQQAWLLERDEARAELARQTKQVELHFAKEVRLRILRKWWYQRRYLLRKRRDQT